MFFDLDLSEMTAPDKNVQMPKKKGEVILADLGSILAWVINGEFGNYASNRGNGRVSLKTAKSAQVGVKADAIGELTIGRFDGEWCSNDWHSRLYGFLQRHAAGEMTAQEYRTIVSVRVQRDFIGGYQANNDSDPHRTSDKIQNPDLIYGAIWQRIIDPLEEGVVKRIGSNKWTVFSSIVYGLNDIPVDSSDWNWPRIYRNRTIAMGIANLLAGQDLRNFRRYHEQAITEAIQYWYDLLMTIKQEAGVIAEKSLKPMNSAGFFGFILVCHLSGTTMLPARSKTLANRILRSLDSVNKICPELCRGNHLDVMKYCDILRDLLKLKTAA